MARLPRHIAERELEAVRRQMGWGKNCLEVWEVEDSSGAGNVLTAVLECEQVTEVFTGFGQRGIPAERVAQRTVEEVQEYLQAAVPVGRHLADQLLIPLALAKGGGFRTLKPSRHTRTNAEVLSMFLPVEVDFQQSAADDWRITVWQESHWGTERTETAHASPKRSDGSERRPQCELGRPVKNWYKRPRSEKNLPHLQLLLILVM